MSASERLRALLPPGDRVVPIFRKTGPLMAGADAFTRAEDLEAFRAALPALTLVVEAAEHFQIVADFYEVSSSAYRQMDAALVALNEALK